MIANWDAKQENWVDDEPVCPFPLESLRCSLADASKVCSAMKRNVRKDLMGYSMLRQNIALTTTEPPKGMSATSSIMFLVGQGFLVHFSLSPTDFGCNMTILTCLPSSKDTWSLGTYFVIISSNKYLDHST